ncbi:MAG: hypothetical protein OXH52_06945 [Gammaproteobacteria bacterium]|nr:hypothetical protein [Gammaproteobacteria bacterium]
MRVMAPDTARPPATGDEARRRVGDRQLSPRRRKEVGNDSAPRSASVEMRSEPGGMDVTHAVRGERAGPAGLGTDTCRLVGDLGGTEGKRSRVGAFDVTGEPGVSDGDAQRG